MTDRATSSTLPVLAILGSISAIAIGLYQWLELYRMRITGVLPNCSIGEQLDCARIWDSPLSTWLHGTTGVPFTAWGVIWGLTALALSIQSRLSYDPTLVARHMWGLRLITACGTVVTIALLSYSISLGVFCPTCLLFYLAVWVVTFASWRQTSVTVAVPRHALAETGFIVFVGCVLAWYPASRTPLPILALPSTTAAAPESTPPPMTDTPAALATLLANAQPQLLQALSDTLARYREAPNVKPASLVPRITRGPANAPVHLVEWVDLLCPHCKNLHFALQEIAREVPTEDWRVETRYYPLDSECNPQMTRSDGAGVRCLGAKILICMTGDPREAEVREQFFARQGQLNANQMWDIAAPADRRAALERCVASEQAKQALQADIAAAEAYGIRGTPMVVINDRVVPALPVTIYALLLTRGNPDHPAFAALPPAKPPAPEQ